MAQRPTLFYAICGEGMGHATRSWPVIRHLSERYEVHVFAGGRVYEYLVSRVEHLHWIETLALIYENNTVNVGASAKRNLQRLPSLAWSVIKMSSLAVALRPRVLVTDFEGISNKVSMLLRLKTVAFDNQHVLPRTAVRYPARYERDADAARRAIFWTVPFANRYVISTFFHPPVTKPATRLVPPVVRPEVLSLESTWSEQVLVYQTSASNTRLVPVLNQVDAEFVVYGLHREERIGNCQLRTFSEARFLEDLARARAVITNGGHTLITEALALQKPVLSEPVVGQFEQVLNAVYLERLGFGRHVERITPEQVQDFLDNLHLYRDAIVAHYPAADNAAALRALEEAILELSPALREVAAAPTPVAFEQIAVKPLLGPHHTLGAEAADGRGRRPRAPGAGPGKGIEDAVGETVDVTRGSE